MRRDAIRRYERGEAISIHAPREGCDHLVDGLLHITGISIHAPREGCDGRPALGRPYSRSHFNPRTPRGVRRGSVFLLSSSGLFQSTHPARGATARRPPRWSASRHFNPRTPRGVRRCGAGVRHLTGPISIHAPREGCDQGGGAPNEPGKHFNPRTPRGVRPLQLVRVVLERGISIHAPREGCDDWRRGQGGCRLISIHAPREGCDLPSLLWVPYSNIFQSTHPARGATANFTKEQRVCLAQFAYLHKGKKAEHTKTNAPMLHEAFLYAFWVRTGRRRRVLLDFARYKIKGSSGR